MDKKDERILVELLLNSRISFKQLGKKTGVSREVATYRVKKLVEEKIITDFYPIINIQSLGFFRNGCLIQLKNIDLKREKEFLLSLVKHPFITYIGIIAKNSRDLREVIMGFRNGFGGMMQIYDIFNNIEILKANVIPRGVFEYI